MRYCALFALSYFVSEGNFQVPSLRDLFSERVICVASLRSLYLEGPYFRNFTVPQIT